MVVNPTIEEINTANQSMDWSQSACSAAARKDATVALLFDEPRLNPDRANIAKKLCVGCPILGECLIYALQFETPLGDRVIDWRADILMGGYSLSERQKLKQAPWYDEFYAVRA